MRAFVAPAPKPRKTHSPQIRPKRRVFVALLALLRSSHFLGVCLLELLLVVSPRICTTGPVPTNDWYLYAYVMVCMK